jgi:hypothetical protein
MHVYVPVLALRRRRAGGCRAEACFRGLLCLLLLLLRAADRHALSRATLLLLYLPEASPKLVLYDGLARNRRLAAQIEHCLKPAGQGGNLSQAESAVGNDVIGT